MCACVCALFNFDRMLDDVCKRTVDSEVKYTYAQKWIYLLFCQAVSISVCVNGVCNLARFGSCQFFSYMQWTTALNSPGVKCPCLVLSVRRRAKGPLPVFLLHSDSCGPYVPATEKEFLLVFPPLLKL